MAMYEAEAICGEFRKFVAPFIPKILSDKSILDDLFDTVQNSSEELQLLNFNTLIDEAEETLRMISPHLRNGQRLLEVGGGIGLVYLFLKYKGFDIISLEPSSGGFGDRYLSGQRILKIAQGDGSGWLNHRIEDLDSSTPKFHLIFSNFVLEHIPTLDEAFGSMGQLLKADGLMIHRCPNYDIPFENHYNIPLFPFYPKLTARFYPKLKGDPLWEELHFTNTREIRQICKKHRLQVSFQRGMLGWAFRRVLDNPIFKSRKGGFARVALFLRATGLLRLLDWIPSSMATPMTFTIVRTN